MPDFVRPAARASGRFARFTRPALLAASVPLFALLALQWAEPQFVRALRDLVFDQYLAARPRAFSADGPVRIIDIDEESLARIGQWPWPRARLAELVEAAGKAGAAAIAIDILLAEPDRSSPEALVKLLPDSPEKAALEARIAASEDTSDGALARAVARYPVVLGQVLSTEGKAKAVVKAGFASAGDPPEAFLPRFAGAVPPLPRLAEAAKGVGFLNFLPDRDLVVRRVPALLNSGGEIAPSLALEALRVAQGAASFTVKASNASGETAFGAKSGMVAVRIGDVTLPTEADGSVRIRYAGSRRERYIPAWRVLAGQADLSQLEGRIVFFGASAAALADIRATPLNPVAPGVEVHAELVEHAVSGSEVRRPDWAKGFEMALILLAGIAAVLLVGRVAAIGMAMIAIGGGGAVLAASWFAFTRADLLVDPVFPASALVSAFASTSMVAYWSTERDRARIREAFGRYVAPAMVAQLASDPHRLRLGGETRELTVLFSDIRNFTKRSEGLPAEEVVRFLNAVHTPLTEAVMRHRGTIDKYMGDGLMAFWNAPLDVPDHTRRALRTALEMVAAVPSIDASLARDLGHGEGLRIGIGINVGLASVGNIGSTHRFDYSIIGDTVNAAARLEPLSKTYGVPVVVSEAVARAAPDFAFVPIDRVVLRGRAAEMTILALVGDEAVAASADFRSFLAHHDAARLHVEAKQRPQFSGAMDIVWRHPIAAQFADVYAIWRARLDGSANVLDFEP